MKIRFILATLLSGVIFATAGPILPTFTYHGLLTSGGARANGSFDFQFTLYNAATGGSPLAGPLSTDDVAVRDGMFTLTLNFGDVFDGNRRWLEMAVRSHGTGAHETQSPRLEITATPHALYALRSSSATTADAATRANTALTANTALSIVDEAVTSFKLAPGAVTPSRLSTDGVLPGQILRFNGSQWIYERYPTYAAGTGLSLSDDTFSIPAGAVTLDMLNPAGAGPDAVIKFDGIRWALGSDNIGPSYRAGAGLRLDGPTFSIEGRSVINGMLALGSVTPDRLSSAGASDGQVLKFDGISWGFAADNTGPTYSAGLGLALGDNTFSLATVPLDHISTSGATFGRVLTYDGSAVVWGTPPSSSGWSLNGNVGITSGNFLGTRDNTPLELRVNNYRVLRLEPAGAAPNIIAGHPDNSVIAGVVGATIGGGGFASGFFWNNVIADNWCTVAGGQANVAGTDDLDVGAAAFATVSGGNENMAANYGATVGGGTGNISGGRHATVPGGTLNNAEGDYSFAAGRRAHAMNPGSFVWGDSTDADFASSAPNQFVIRASGGVGIGTAAPQGQLHVSAATASGGANTATFSAPAIGPHASHIHYGPTGDWYIRSAQPGGQVILQDTGGNVGLGTGSPEWPLDVRAVQAVGRFHSTDANYGSVIELRNDASDPASLGAINFNNSRDETPGQIAYHTSGQMSFRVAGRERLRIADDGNVSVGVLTITGGADLAEPFHMSGDHLPKGSVVVIDGDHAGRLKLSDQAYDRRVAGIVSGANGINPGLTLHQEGAIEGSQNVALSGRVYVLADASDGPIRPGDLLTSSDVPGHAMKVADHNKAQGAIVGKAMTALAAGRGMVLVLVSLQ